MSFWEGTQAEETALKAIALIYTQGNLLTNQNMQAALQSLGAQFAAPPILVEITLDGSGVADIARTSKINYFVVQPSGGAGQQDMTAITEANTWSDGDVAYFFSKEFKLLNVRLSAVSVNLWNPGNFIKMARMYGAWQLESKNPDTALPFFGYVDEVTVLGTDTELDVTHSILKVSAVTAPTPAEAVYAVDTASGTDGTISLFVDTNLVTTFTYTAASSPVAVINGLSAAMATYTSAFINTTDIVSIPPTITVIDDANLGAAGNSLLLSDMQLDGATGTIQSNFSGGVNGVASNVTIDTINGLVEGNSYQIHNAMAANTVTLTDVGGNLVGSVCPLVLAAGDWAWVSCVNPSEGRVK